MSRMSPLKEKNQDRSIVQHTLKLEGCEHAVGLTAHIQIMRKS